MSEAPLLTQEAIIRELRRFQDDPFYRDERNVKTVPMACFCDFAGVSRRSVYLFL